MTGATARRSSPTGPCRRAPADLIDRLILVLVNECVACLRERVVEDADLIDAAVIFGTGFAPFRGGPLTYARARGVSQLVARLQELTVRYGARFTPGQRLGGALRRRKSVTGVRRAEGPVLPSNRGRTARCCDPDIVLVFVRLESKFASPWEDMAEEQAATVQVLKTFAPLDGMKRENLTALAKKVTVKSLSRGRALFSEGDTDKRTVWLVSGRVEALENDPA